MTKLRIHTDHNLERYSARRTERCNLQGVCKWTEVSASTSQTTPRRQFEVPPTTETGTFNYTQGYNYKKNSTCTLSQNPGGQFSKNLMMNLHTKHQHDAHVTV